MVICVSTNTNHEKSLITRLATELYTSLLVVSTKEHALLDWSVARKLIMLRYFNIAIRMYVVYVCLQGDEKYFINGIWAIF